MTTDETVEEKPSPADLSELADTVETLRLAKVEKEKWEAVEQAARERIEEAMGDAEEGQIDGHTVITWKHTRGQTRVDVKKLRAEIPEAVLLPYLYTTEPGRHFKPVE